MADNPFEVLKNTRYSGKMGLRIAKEIGRKGLSRERLLAKHKNNPKVGKNVEDRRPKKADKEDLKVAYDRLPERMKKNLLKQRFDDAHGKAK